MEAAGGSAAPSPLQEQVLQLLLAAASDLCSLASHAADAFWATAAPAAAGAGALVAGRLWGGCMCGVVAWPGPGRGPGDKGERGGKSNVRVVNWPAALHSMEPLMFSKTPTHRTVCALAGGRAISAAGAEHPTAIGPSGREGAALMRARIAWACLALALGHVTQGSADCHTSTSTSTSSTLAPAALRAARQRFASALLALVSKVGSQPLSKGHAARAAGLHAAAAACDALRVAAGLSSEVDAAVRARLDAEALVAAALRDSQAGPDGSDASAAGAQQLSSEALAGLEGAKWPLLDAATAAAAYLTRQPEQGVRKHGNPAAGGELLPLALPPALAAEVLAQAMATLGDYPENHMLRVLRCLRRCWGHVLAAGPAAHAQAAVAAGCGEAEAGHAALQALCWAVARSIWNAACVTERKTGPMSAALVSTSMPPALYVVQVRACVCGWWCGEGVRTRQ